MFLSVRRFSEPEMSPLGLGHRSWGGHTADITVPICHIFSVTAPSLFLAWLRTATSFEGYPSLVSVAVTNAMAKSNLGEEKGFLGSQITDHCRGN